MSNIKDQIITLVKQRHHSYKVALEQEKDPRSKHAVDLIARIREDSRLIELIDSLPEETCKDSLQVPETCKENKDSFTSLKEAARKYAGEKEFYWVRGNPYTSQEWAFKAGAEWQKEQMMKEAVEAKIYGYDDGSFELIASWLDIPKNSIYKDGDKVKIIIVKK